MITTNVNGNAISAGFISQIQSDLPNLVSRLWYNGAELSCDIVNITVQKGSCGQQTFMVGDVIGDMLTATVKNLSTDIKDQLIQCHIGALVNGAYEYISLGTFRVSEVKKTRYQAEITAYSSVVADTGTRLDITGLNNPTIAQLASKVAGKLNCTVSFDAGIDTSLTVDAQLDGLTYYQTLQIIAICSGGYVVNTHDGNVQVRKFDTSPTLSVGTGMMINLPEFAEQPYEVESVGVLVSEATTDNEGNEVEEVFYSDNPNYIVVTKSGTDYYLKAQNGNYILANVKPETADIYFSCPYMSESIFNTNVMGIKGYTYSPATIDLTLGDPRLEGCDVLTVTDVDSNTYTVPCHKIIHKYTGGFTSEITSCEASDSANNIGTSFPITQRLETQSRQIGTAQATAENAYKIAGDTNQYFWFTGEGSDTGAHITETPQAQFIADPSNGGGNLLARSNGVAIRDGLDELAIFSADQLRIGMLGANRAMVNSGSMQLYDDTNAKYFEVSADGMTYGTNTVASTAYADQAEADAIATASADATAKANVAEANGKKEATNYLYYNASTGLTVAESSPSTATRKVNIHAGTGVRVYEDANNHADVTSSGLEVYQGGTSVANFGATARVGKSSESRMDLDYHSLQMVDKEGDTYFYVSDLRGTDGKATLTEASIANGTDADFYVSEQITAVVSVTVNGTAVTPTTVGTYKVILPSAPTAGATVSITYTTTSANAKAYTIGKRASGYAVGAMSFVSGNNNVATNGKSHAEGEYTMATGQYSHAEGYGSSLGALVASGIGSHAEGNDTVASGEWSHAEGNATVASGMASHAGGVETIASGYGQTAIGRYNNGGGLFVVGNGLGSSTRSNALSVDAYGELRIKGNTYIGCNADSTGGTLLKVLKVTKSSVSSLSTTISNGNITANMECIHSVLSNPSAQTGDWTVTTSDGSVQISGSISGTTNITLYLAEPST